MTTIGRPFSSRSDRSCLRQHQPGWNESSGALCYGAKANDRGRPRLLKQQSRRTVRISIRPWQVSTVFMWALVFGLLVCCSGADAEYVQIAKPLESLNRRTELLFDRSEPPKVPAPRVRLERRQEQVDSVSATPSFVPAPTAGGEASSSLLAGSTLQTATPSPGEDIPAPFDTSLGNNFTSPSCPAFFQTFLPNATFNECLPFSLLLQTSNGFFSATRSLVRLTQALDATCNVPNFEKCTAVMADLATQIQLEEHCGEDFEMENPMVRQAYNGFVAYQPLYHAGCLTNGAGDYCFASAVSNASAPSGAYVYYLPLGSQLPSTSQPTCNRCLRNTMSIYAAFAAGSAQPLSDTYGPAVDRLDTNCGNQFAETVAVSTGDASRASVAGLGLLTFLLAFFFSLA